MPLLRRKLFTPKPLPHDLDPDGQYFVCEATNEVFENYEEFFDRVIVCNSLVWTCSVTGRPGLTYTEAVNCEKKALSIIDRFPKHLRGPVLYLTTLTHRTRINDLNEDVYVYIRDVYFKNEVIEAIHEDEWWEGKVVDSFRVEAEDDGDDRAPDEPDWDHIRYHVRLWDDETNKYISGDEGMIEVDTSCIRREKNGLHSINQDKCKMYLKYHCEQVDGIWKVKQEFLDKYNISEAKFSDYICLEEPQFTQSKMAKKGKKSRRSEEDLELIRDVKRQAKEEKDARVKDAKSKAKKEAKEKMTPEEKAAQRVALKEKQRLEREKLREEAAARMAEEKVRLRELKEQEKLKAREEKRLLADKLRAWNKPRDDLMCDDLAPLPAALPVPPVIAPYFGDMVMVVEFLSVFGEHLGLENSFPDGVSFDVVQKALFESDINGPLSDLLCFFMSAIFNCIDEEEVEEKEMESESKKEVTDDPAEMGELSYAELLSNATAAAQTPLLNHGTSLRDFQLDPLTVSEVLRLHFLASGAKGSSANIKFRYQSRGGYTSIDDAGIALKKDHPHILNDLATGNVFDLSIADKLTILSTLINQLLSFASLRDLIEDAMEQHKTLSYELRQVQWAEQRREREETQFKNKRRLEQRLQQQLQLVSGSVKMETGEAGDTPSNEQNGAPPSDGQMSNEEAAREARRIAKRIINETAKLDPNRLPQDTGRSRRKNAIDEFNWREYDMTEWNNLEERYLSDEDLEVLSLRRKEIETRQKQDYIDKEAEITDRVADYSGRVGTHALGQDRWGRSFWSFNSVPHLYIERIDKDLMTQSTDLDTSLHSEKENSLPSKGENSPASTTQPTNGENHSLPNAVLENDPSHDETTSWTYYSSLTQVDEVVSSLNNRGFREGILKHKIVPRKRKLQQLSEQYPDFTLDEHSIHEACRPVAASNQNIKSKTRIAKGHVQDSSAQESLELNLREMLLDLEERIFVGSLGSLKVTNRATWREALESGGYSPQDKELSLLTVLDSDASDCDLLVVRDLQRALLQIQRAVESKYLCKPLGTAEVVKSKPGPKKSKKIVEDSAQGDNDGSVKTMDRWTESLLSSTSLSQIFLHMCTLESSITWSKSALNARCRLCRRKGDGEKMLLCDMCDRGHHMYCLKPPVKDVPKGDWYCPECRPKTTRARKASKRKSFYEEEQEEEVTAEEDVQTDDSVYDEETASSSAEEELKHPKIKLLKSTGKSSGRSSPASSTSGKVRRSRTSTPEVDSSRARRSAAPSPESLSSRKNKGGAKEGSNRKSKGSRPPTPTEGGSRSSLGSARANLSEEVAQLAQCEEIVREMMEMNECWPFLTPVNRREVPDYYSIIKHPMDCQTIMSRVKMVKYTNVSEMISDIRQMFTNCSLYNETNTEIYKLGERMSRFFEKQLKSLKLEKNPAKRSRRI